MEHAEFRKYGRRRRAVDKPLKLDLEVGHNKPLPLAALRALAPALHEAPRVRLRRRRDDGREGAVHLRRVPDCESRTDYRVLVARRKTHTAKSASGPAKAAR